MGFFGSRYNVDSVVFVMQKERTNPLDCTYAKVLRIEIDPTDKKKKYYCRQLYPIIVNNQFMGWFAGVSAAKLPAFWCTVPELSKTMPKGVQWKYKF